jgi:hypothetical protein
MRRRKFFGALIGSFAILWDTLRGKNKAAASNLTTPVQGDQSMFVHSVYFWLKPDLTDAQKKEFVKKLNALTTIETVKTSYVGTPASTDRPIIDRTYSYALILAFENKADHDVYQEHPVHDEFRAIADYWMKVQIYDAVTE